MNQLKVAHIRKDNKIEAAKELGKILRAKWEKRDYEKAKKQHENRVNQINVLKP